MSTTPAAHLARLKVTYPQWTIRAIEPGKGTGYTAHRRDGRGLRNLYAPTLDGLERRLSAEHKDPVSGTRQRRRRCSLAPVTRPSGHDRPVARKRLR